MMQDLADQAEKHVEEWRVEAERLVGAGKVTGEKAVGEPAAEILENARAWGSDLIVMGTHGRTGLEHALMGSIAERVVRRAHCPVLTVRPVGR